MENSELEKALDTLLTFDIGISVAVCGQIYIRQVSDGFAVGTEYSEYMIQNHSKVNWESVFENKQSAISKFIEERKKEKIGDDFWQSHDT